MYKHIQADLEVNNINGTEENHSLIQSPEEQKFDCLCWKMFLLWAAQDNSAIVTHCCYF